MFSVGDTVLYGTDGVCTVTDITTRTFTRETTEYYVLTPLYQSGSVIYVPTASDAAVSKMRRVLTREEIRAILHEIGKEEASPWITDENARRTSFKTILLSGDRRELIRMIKTIYLHSQEQKANGRKLHNSDQLMMKSAEKLLYDEFAHVMSIKPDEVLEFIVKEIEQ